MEYEQDQEQNPQDPEPYRPSPESRFGFLRQRIEAAEIAWRERVDVLERSQRARFDELELSLRRRIDYLDEHLTSRISRVEASIEKVTTDIGDLRNLAFGRFDDLGPGVLDRLGIEPDNPGSFRTQGRIVDLLVARAIEMKISEALLDKPLPQEFVDQIKASFDQRALQEAKR